MSKVDYQYVVSDYYATGEGRTVAILITRADPLTEDYIEHPKFVDGKYIPGKTRVGPGFRALREFGERFDQWTARGAVILTRKQFLEQYSSYIPMFVYSITDPETTDAPGNFNYCSQVHMNFS